VLNEFLRDLSLDITTVYVHAPTKVKDCVLKNNVHRRYKSVDLFGQFHRHSAAILVGEFTGKFVREDIFLREFMWHCGNNNNNNNNGTLAIISEFSVFRIWLLVTQLFGLVIYVVTFYLILCKFIPVINSLSPTPWRRIGECMYMHDEIKYCN
jgi:hypothetical protein